MRSARLWTEEGAADRPVSLARRLHEEEGGMIMIASVVVFLFFLLLANLVWNMGWTSTTKIKTQNAADATAYSSTLWMARGHNAITATNHLMGEMMAFVVVRAALGERHEKRLDHIDIPRSTLPKRLQGLLPFLGPDDFHQDRRFRKAGRDLTTAYNKAEAGSAIPPIAYSVMEDSAEVQGDEIEMGSTISDSRYYLIKILTLAYEVKFIAGLLEDTGFPPAVAVGVILDGVALGVDLMVLGEWIGLNGLEVAYRSTEPLHIAIWEGGFRAARKFQKDVEREAPGIALRAGEALARDNGCTGAIYPTPSNGAQAATTGQLKFHLEGDPWGIRGRSDAANEFMRKSQIVRATYPWVKYHRRPMIDTLNFMLLSRAAYHFVFWTNDLTLVKCREHYNRSGAEQFYLPVLAGSHPDNKRNEAWTRDSGELERRFAVVGFAHHPAPRYSAPSLFGNPAPKGFAAYSMALVYNANGNGGRADEREQPNWGWDTLNWELPTSQSRAVELPPDPDPLSPDNGHQAGRDQRPTVKLNWQAKLVPASVYVYEGIPGTTGPHRELLMRIMAMPPALRGEMHREFHHH